MSVCEWEESIMAEQTILHTKPNDVKICRDGKGVSDGMKDEWMDSEWVMVWGLSGQTVSGWWHGEWVEGVWVSDGMRDE